MTRSYWLNEEDQERLNNFWDNMKPSMPTDRQMEVVENRVRAERYKKGWEKTRKIVEAGVESYNRRYSREEVDTAVKKLEEALSTNNTEKKRETEKCDIINIASKADTKRLLIF